MGGPEGSTEESGVFKTEAGTEADVGTRMLMLLVVLKRLESRGTSLKDSRYQKSFVERNMQRVCARVSLTPLTLHNVSLQIFNFYH